MFPSNNTFPVLLGGAYFILILAPLEVTQNGRDQREHRRETEVERMRELRELNINEGGKPVGRRPPTDEQVREFEAAFGVRLPSDYISLLQHSNGGHPELNSFRPKGADDVSLWGVNRFYHLSDDKTDVEGLWRVSKEWQAATSRKFIPIANDGGGNQVVLSYDSTSPTVKLCIHNEGFRMLDVTDSFSEFIDSLQEDPDMI